MMIGVLLMIVTMVMVATMRIKMVANERHTIILEDFSFTEQNWRSMSATIIDIWSDGVNSVLAAVEI